MELLFTSKYIQCIDRPIKLKYKQTYKINVDSHMLYTFILHVYIMKGK